MSPDKDYTDLMEPKVHQFVRRRVLRK
jgi:hypothetical protein